MLLSICLYSLCVFSCALNAFTPYRLLLYKLVMIKIAWSFSCDETVCESFLNPGNTINQCHVYSV